MADFSSKTSHLFCGLFSAPLSTLLNLERLASRKSLSVSSKKSDSALEYTFYELESLIDAFCRSELFAAVNFFVRPQSAKKIVCNYPLVDQLLGRFEDVVTFSLMLAASGWLGNVVPRLLKNRPAERTGFLLAVSFFFFFFFGWCVALFAFALGLISLLPSRSHGSSAIFGRSFALSAMYEAGSGCCRGRRCFREAN